MRPVLAFAASAALAATSFAQGSFVNFESTQVHPVALTPDQSKLLVVNTADARLSVFDVTHPSGPTLMQEIPVGIEPISVHARTNDEVWVANHTSDSLSVVSLSQGIVTDTIAVKDEPSDVTFAGTPERAFVTASRSNEVRVFDVTTHALVATLPVFGEYPAAIVRSADGSRVYAAFLQSGNRTTIIPADQAPPQSPPTNPNLPTPPQVGLIVDATDPAWAPSVIKYSMPDNDVVEIDASALSVVRYFSRLGTTNFNLAVSPTTGDLWVSNTDARNLVHFEPVLQGHLVDNRLTKVTTGVTPVATPIDLNPTINYAILPNPAALAIAIAQPTDVAFDPSGSHMWVASFGTDRVAKVDSTGAVVARVEIGPATGSSVDPRTKRGPRGLALNASAQRLYVSNRLSNTLSVVDTATSQVLQELPVGSYDPTPAVIRQGRGFLYDAKLSGNGTGACAACHIDGDKDAIAWDLGNPGGDMQTVNDPLGIFGGIFQMHPMKGPMTTQSLKGLQGTDPLHWRGDRSDFTAFNPAFHNLMGGSALADADMVAYRDFIETVAYEPNPNQNLNRTLPTSLPGIPGNPVTGQTTFQTNQYQPLLTCNTCHTLPDGTVSGIIPGIALQESQDFKVPHLRNLYQKNNFTKAVGASAREGFGFLHDGAIPDLFTFLSAPVFGNVSNNTTLKNNLRAFLLCFDTGMAPAVGYSRTIRQVNANDAGIVADVTLLQGQALANNIDLIGKGTIDGALRGLVYQPAQGNYKTDKSGVGPFTWAQLQTKALAGQAYFSLMGVPKGSGNRMGVDRDEDGVLDGDDATAGFLLSYGGSTPGCAGPLAMGANSLPFVGNSLFAFTSTNVAPSTLGLVLMGDVQDLAGTPIVGINLHVSLASTMLLGVDMLGDGSGFGVAPLPIPPISAFSGIALFAQTLSLDPCSPVVLVASQGLRMEMFEF